MKDIIVHVDNTASCARRVEFAAALAARVGAQLAGVYAQHVALMPPDEGLVEDFGAASAPERIGYSEQVTRAETQAAERILRAGSATLKTNTAWYTMIGGDADVLVAYARYADLVVVSQTSPGGDDVAAEVALRSGRPVLIAPHTSDYRLTAEHILVAWDASREAARALHDALPLLRDARRVTVLSVGNLEKAPPGADVAAHLAHHDVGIELVQEHDVQTDAGAFILERAEKLSCDLIVMGAYGHSPWRERVLGGTTLHVLKHVTVPVLVSH